MTDETAPIADAVPDLEVTPTPSNGKAVARVGSRNAEVHGGRRWREAVRYGLTNIPLPDDSGHIENAMNKWRRAMEDDVLRAKGVVTTRDAAAINTSVRMETLARVAGQALNLEGKKMSPETRRLYWADIAKGTTERDRALSALGLDAHQLPSLWDVPMEGIDQ